MSAQTKANKIRAILAEVYSSEEKKAFKAIKELEVHGDASAIKPLADILSKGELSEKNRKAIIELFCSLKDSSAAAAIMELLRDEQYDPLKTELLTAVWNMKVDFSSYIDEFVELAAKGNFMQALDCLTIIENMQGPFMEEDILESQLHLRNYLENSAPKDMQKAQIMSEIAIAIKDINEQLAD